MVAGLSARQARCQAAWQRWLRVKLVTNMMIIKVIITFIIIIKVIIQNIIIIKITILPFVF